MTEDDYAKGVFINARSRIQAHVRGHRPAPGQEIRLQRDELTFNDSASIIDDWLDNG